MTAEVVVDARGLRCPLPVIRAAAAARDATPGSLVTILWTDPAARHDLPAWARMRGHTLVGTVAIDAGPSDVQPIDIRPIDVQPIDVQPIDGRPGGGTADPVPGTPPVPAEAFATTIRVTAPAR